MQNKPNWIGVTNIDDWPAKNKKRIKAKIRLIGQELKT